MFSLHFDGLPQSERDEALSLQRNVASLSSVCDSFAAAVELFEHCSNPSLQSQANPNRIDVGKFNLHKNWRLIAARSGAISIYEFYQITQGINASIPKCPTLEPYVDAVARKKSASIFAESFPRFADLRHFAAHGAEMTNNHQKAMQHALKPFGSTFVIMNCSIIENQFSITSNGVVLGYSVNKESANKLKAALDAYLEALRPLQDFRQK
ncbi:MAG TPA: hypothetical protein VIF40_14980 [Methylosinus sp.]|jgi:hypothetical protein|uniref:hypothetical protein n=1 Tax=Methylosinus sp. TaxID=427 RepID=UPI002F93C23F